MASNDCVLPIAIVGMACRFPGDAVSPEHLWEMVTSGENAWSEFPKSRLNIDNYYHPSGGRQGSMNFRGAHFLKEDPGVFDSSFFSIPHEEAKAVDPQQRILLEVAIEALDNAGIDRHTLRKSETGVWIGSFVKDYETICMRDIDDSPTYGATGNSIAIMSNRISYFLDINGPSMTIDTGCSASLVCIHNACQSLRDGETDLALAGGAGLILSPNTMMPMRALNILSPDGKCFAFDARANGYGRGEGFGIIVLKRLTDAIRDNDTIRAVIRGSRVNQDGRTPGITLPSTEAQLRNIKSLYQQAGLPLNKTDFVECHGTGTQAGDGRELEAVGQAFCSERSPSDPIIVGSIKTNIGHLEAAAGVAGLIKGVLAVERGLIPKHINFESPGNPTIDFDRLKIKVPTENMPWPTPGLRRASINCFGFGGTNAHAVIEDAAHYLKYRGLLANHNTTLTDGTRDVSLSSSTAGSNRAVIKKRNLEMGKRAAGQSAPTRDDRTHLFLFSAHEQKVLQQIIHNHIDYIQKQGQNVSGVALEDLAYTLDCRRTRLEWKCAVVARSPEELSEKLRQVTVSDMIRKSEEYSPKIAFIFGGQGAQWYAMARELLSMDIFAQSILDASEYLSTRLSSPFILLAELLKDEKTSTINQPFIAHPATTAIQVALVDLMTGFLGITPMAVVGHSSGEIAAAYAAGSISRESAWELAFYRGRCAAALTELPNVPEGRMLAAELSEAAAEEYVDQVGRDKVVVACINSPASITFSGDADAIQEIHETLDGSGIFSRVLAVTTAYHSHHMQACEALYLESISHIKPQLPQVVSLRHPHDSGGLVSPSHLKHSSGKVHIFEHDEIPAMYSSLTGDKVMADELDCAYWARNLVSPVKFTHAVRRMMTQPSSNRPDIILELGPHATLQSPIKQILDCIPQLKVLPEYFSALRRNTDASRTFLEAVGELWKQGCNVKMQWVVMRNLQLRRPKLLVDMPNYPWNHEILHWNEPQLSLSNRFPKHGRYDLIGRPVLEGVPSQPRWRGFIRLSELPWVKDHQVQKTMVYPASGMVCMIVEAATQLVDSGLSGVELLKFQIDKAMLVPSTERGLEYVVILNQHSVSESVHESQPTYLFSILSQDRDDTWHQHGHGIVKLHLDEMSAVETGRIYERYIAVKDTCNETIVPRQFYETLDVIGMNYGPLFQNIVSMAKGDEGCTFTVRIPDTKANMPDQFEYPHVIHPGTLDAIIQAALAMAPDPMVPSSIGSIFISTDMPRGAGKELAGFVHTELHGSREAVADFCASDTSWKDEEVGGLKAPLVVIKDMHFTKLDTLSDSDSLGPGFLPSYKSLCSEIIWEDHAIARDPNIDSKSQVLLLVPDKTDKSLEQLVSEILLQKRCQVRTLSQVSDNDLQANYCISLLEAQLDNLVFWDCTPVSFHIVHKILTTFKGILWVTNGSELEVPHPKSALMQAVSRTINSENPDKHVATFDIGPGMLSSVLVDRMLGVCEILFETKSRGIKEAQFAERDGKLSVPRLVPVHDLNHIIETGVDASEQRIPCVGKYIQHEATYVLAGGLGGLGIEIAKLLVRHGAKHLVFLSRSGARTQTAQAFIDSVVAMGDAVFENMTHEDWQYAVRPKTIGSTNLYETMKTNLDFIVFLSSSAGVIGNRGQANYSAGNVYQDALARHIESNNNGHLHAVSIDLGPVLGAGMLAEDPETLDILKASGFYGIRLQDFILIVERAITGYINNTVRLPTQVITGIGTGGLTKQNKPADPYWTRTALFTHMNKVDLPENEDGGTADGDSSVESVKERLAEAIGAEAASAIVSSGLQQIVARSMKSMAQDVDISRSLKAYGVDSLVAVSLRSWVIRECGVEVSVFDVLSDMSISALSEVIVERGGFGSGMEQ